MVSETPCGWNSIFINPATQRFTASLDLFFYFLWIANWFTTEFPVGITADRTW